MTDFTEDSEDWSEFKPSPETGDLKVLNEHIQKATEIQDGLKKLDARAANGKQMLKDLLEQQIPELMSRCGFQAGDGISFGGVTVTVKSDSFANVPSISAIEDEKDDDRRAQLLDRRHKGLAILEDKAPALIKRKFEIQFEKDDVEEARAFEDMLDSCPDMPPVVKGLSVHPATLTKWINEVKETGYNFTDEEVYAFGIYPRRVAKIKK